MMSLRPNNQQQLFYRVAYTCFLRLNMYNVLCLVRVIIRIYLHMWELNKKKTANNKHLPKQNTQSICDQQCETDEQWKAIGILGLLDLTVLRYVRYHTADDHGRCSRTTNNMWHTEIQFIAYNPVIHLEAADLYALLFESIKTSSVYSRLMWQLSQCCCNRSEKSVGLLCAWLFPEFNWSEWVRNEFF